jgi:hypothetical protein
VSLAILKSILSSNLLIDFSFLFLYDFSMSKVLINVEKLFKILTVLIFVLYTIFLDFYVLAYIISRLSVHSYNDSMVWDLALFVFWPAFIIGTFILLIFILVYILYLIIFTKQIPKFNPFKYLFELLKNNFQKIHLKVFYIIQILLFLSFICILIK